MKKGNKVLIGVIVVLVVALAALFVWRTWFGQPEFSAVYMRTGDLYFGRLTSFPHFGLKQVYLLQVNSADTANPLSVQRFANVFWGPEDFLSINRDEVVWTTALSKESPLAKLILENPTLTSQTPQQNVQQAPQQNVQQEAPQQVPQEQVPATTTPPSAGE